MQSLERRTKVKSLLAGDDFLKSFRISDENMDGKLDTNWLGAPKEGYGFSNDAKAFLSAPSFSAATFQYDGGTLDLTIPLHY